MTAAPQPLDVPGATAAYLTVYALAWALHFPCAAYVLAGAGTVAFEELTGVRTRAGAALRDWLPFALGATITTGVAPLVFVQVLYPESFYSANLLLRAHWAAVVPLLVALFYLLYAIKGARFAARGRAARAALTLGVFAGFVAVAGLWTGNHVLSLAGPQAWVERYGASPLAALPSGIAPRLVLWLAVAPPFAAAIVAWQRDGATDARARAEWRAMAAVAGAGLLVAMVVAALLAREHAGALARARGLPLLFPAGALVQALAWVAVARSARAGPAARRALALGLAPAVLGLAAAREALRLDALADAELLAAHRRVATGAGAAIFVVLFLVCGALIAWCVRTVRRRPRAATSGPAGV